MECHGDNLAGKKNWFNLGPLGSADAANLTSGKGEIGSQFTDEDFVRVLRHGVKPDGTSVFVMPASDFYYLSDQDLGDVIAYIKSVPPVDGGNGAYSNVHLSFLGNVMYGAGLFGNDLVAGKINQTSQPATASEPAVTRPMEIIWSTSTAAAIVTARNWRAAKHRIRNRLSHRI